ncbi:MAG TPA: CHAP domain-containing protein [Candidatus Saccharimonadales bacterium]|nr:CHAP domain-containing protein [Candidatus Saccharimonadales bacterium]
MVKKHSTRNLISMFKRSPSLALVMILGIMLLSGIGQKLVHAVNCSSAADCQAQINNLSNQNAQAQQNVGSLQSQAQSYQGAIDALNAQITSVQNQLSANQAKQVSLEQQITANEQEIAAKKSTLADDVKTMYVDGQMTTLEELATSQNLSDFVDKQQYQAVVQNQLDAIIQQIDTLQQQLQSQQQQVTGLIATEQTQNAQLSNAEAQQQQLLSYNQSQQDAYNQQIAADNSNISALNARLAALNTVSGQSIDARGNCGGGYPASATNQSGGNWGCDFPKDDGYVDNWNMYNRECVSYTAYMAFTKYGVSTNQWGDAYEWIAAAESHGYTVDQTPTAGSIAIRNRAPDWMIPNSPDFGDVGHAMYVDSANSDGTITVQEFNEYYNGTYDQRTFDPSSYADRGGLYFIHFN